MRKGRAEMPIGRGDDKNRAASRLSGSRRVSDELQRSHGRRGPVKTAQPGEKVGLEFSFVGDVRDIVQEALDAPVPSEAK